MRSCLSKASKTLSPKNKPKPPRRQPQRTCIICRETADKRSLIRIVRTAQGGVQIDQRGKVPGRGAYLCHKVSCWETALKSSALAHALMTELSAEERQQLETFAQKLMNTYSTPTESRP